MWPASHKTTGPFTGHLWMVGTWNNNNTLFCAYFETNLRGLWDRLVLEVFGDLWICIADWRTLWNIVQNPSLPNSQNKTTAFTHTSTWSPSESSEFIARTTWLRILRSLRTHTWIIHRADKSSFYIFTLQSIRDQSLWLTLWLGWGFPASETLLTAECGSLWTKNISHDDVIALTKHRL